MPRRTALAVATYSLPGWKMPGIMTAVGGVIMFAGAAIFYLVLIMTIVAGEKAAPSDVPLTATVTAPASSGWEVRLDALRYFVAVAVALVLIVYGPLLMHLMPPHLASHPFLP